MTIDTTKLEAALKAGDETAVRKEFSAVIDRPYTAEEEGKAFLAIGRAYTTLMNSVNREYLEKLRAVKRALEALNSGKRKIGEALKLAKTRTELAR